MVPLQATAPALIIVGYLMMTALSESEEQAEPGHERVAERKVAGIDFSDLALGFSAAITILVMPFTYSITNGIGFGFISYAVIRIAQGEWRRVHPLLYVVAGGFLLYFLVPLLQDNLSWV
jgi:AGZA family xanthine/uracil permease-like MFS transporter